MIYLIGDPSNDIVVFMYYIQKYNQFDMQSAIVLIATHCFS